MVPNEWYRETAHYLVSSNDLDKDDVALLQFENTDAWLTYYVAKKGEASALRASMEFEKVIAASNTAPSVHVVTKPPSPSATSIENNDRTAFPQ